MRVERRKVRQAGWAIVVAALAVLLIFGSRSLGLMVSWLWFGEVGQRPVFWTILAAKTQLAVLFGAAFFLMMFVNLWLARRSTPPLTPHYEDFPIRVRVGRMARAGLSMLLLGGSLIAGLLAGLEAAGHWDEYLRFQHPQRFGQLDPVFGRDLGFYIFRLPFLTYLYEWAFLTVLLVTAATALVYYFDRAVEVLQGYTHVAPSVRVHLSVLLGILSLLKLWGYRLDTSGLLLATNGSFFGAFYTDLHARLLALNVLSVLALVAALGFFANAYLRLLWLPGAALALMVVASLVIGGVYPGVVQRFTVQPNELNMERPYLQRHLEMTRSAYGLDRVKVTPFGHMAPVRRENLQKNGSTIRNIRLWDYRPLRQTYQQLQSLKPYYSFVDVDIDRYTIGGQTRQVMLAARELNQNDLPQQARRWVNEWLEYTHGYGFVMSPVNEVNSVGAPVFWAHDAPQKTPVELPVQRPQIYFGQGTQTPVIAPSRTAEFDHPEGEEAVRTGYEGTGGVPLYGTLRRLLFATYFGESNILISSQITPASRILFHRRIDERAARIAPFLAFDADPYLVVANGRLYWIQDAYTTAAHYPYSMPARGAAVGLRRWGLEGLQEDGGDFNYIRNAVKVITDAYDGRISFYVSDATDPVVRSYQAALPSLFQPLSAMPASLRQHLRYPEGLFTVQAGLYANYHVTNADSLFVQSDLWNLPEERAVRDTPQEMPMPGMPIRLQSAGSASGQTMSPFYVTMRLPQANMDEFVLMLPFQISRPPSMPAWLCARSDGAHYGQLLAYSFPQGVDGPVQVETFIDQNPDISKEFSLWNQHGSRVLRGHLLALPLDQSVLYVKPIYLASEATENSVPRLTRVILVNAGRAVMAPSLGQALEELVRGGAGVVGEASSTRGPSQSLPEQRSTAARPGSETGAAASGQRPPAGATVQDLVGRANEAFEAATEAQRRGDWASYGLQLRRLEESLRELQRKTGGIQ
jgi:uncharacterized protein